MKLRILILNMTFIVSQLLYSQTGVIEGKITDSLGESIPFAQVLIVTKDSSGNYVSTSRGAKANMNGFYTIKGLISGSYCLRFKALNKETCYEYEIQVNAGKTIPLDITLHDVKNRIVCSIRCGSRSKNRVKKAIEKASVDQSELLSIYPNPCYGFLSVEPPVKAKKVEIFNMKGEKIYENDLKENASKLQVDLNPFLNGVYFMICTTRDQIKFYEKIVLNR